MKSNNINILSKEECTGCSVCYYICPHKAIDMEETKEGFLYPIVNDDKCTDCNICVKKCHVINDIFNDLPDFYISISKDQNILNSSSSGGAFSIFANYVLENNGYVCGAAFNSDWNVEHIIIDNKDDLVKLKGSKYVESFTGKIFGEIKKLLNDNKLVLFTGCPCQVASLLFFLNKKYDNLITIDLLCHGVPPQKVWQKYLADKHDKNKIDYIAFRYKEKLGNHPGLYIKYIDNMEYIIDKNSISSDGYMKLFFDYSSCKYECIKCKYRNIYRVSDISIGDGFGELNSTGESLILLNTKKGKHLFNIVKNKMKYKNFKKYNYFERNNALNVGTFTIYGNRKYFFDNLNNIPFAKLANNTFNIKNNVGLVTMCFQINYGAILTSFALHKIVEKFGYNPILIFPKYIYKNMWKGMGLNAEECMKFANMYLNVSKEYNSLDETLELNDICDSFIVGSDVVWMPSWSENLHFNMLSFTNDDKKRISYSSSFGIDRFDGTYKEVLMAKYYLNRFDRISVREKSGIDVCKNIFNVEATHVLDPVFLVDRYSYDIFIRKSKKNISSKYAVSYLVLNRSLSKKEKVINYISEKIGIQFRNIVLKNMISDFVNIEDDVSVEDWLYMIKNSDFVVTDSFHGLCFAIYYNKEFIVVQEENDNIRPQRMYSLLNMINLGHRIIYGCNYNDIDSILLEHIDYEVVNKKLDSYKELSLNYLKEALECEKKYNNIDYGSLISLLIRDNIHINSKINSLYNKLENEVSSYNNWIKLFGIYNSKNYIYIFIFGIKFTLKVNEKLINKIANFIPIKKVRNNFKNKFIIF